MKFRVWDKEKGYFLFDDIGINASGGIILHNGSDMKIIDDDEEEFNDYIVEFSTTLSDKNGKEIYEGDILEYTDTWDGIPGVKISINTTVSDVYFEDGSFNFDEGVLFNNLVLDTTIIIGNIHENPELLGDK